MRDDDCPMPGELKAEACEEEVLRALKESWRDDHEDLAFDAYVDRYYKDAAANMADEDLERRDPYAYYGISRASFG